MNPTRNLEPARWQRNKKGTLCPVCGEPYKFFRIIIGEDLSVKNEKSPWDIFVTWQHVGNEYLHSNGRLCQSRARGYLLLPEVALQIMREGEQDEEA